MPLECTVDDLVEFFLDLRRKIILPYKSDFVVAVCGYQGTGKSALSVYLAYYLNKELGIDPTSWVCFTPPDVCRADVNLPPGAAIVWDEVGTMMFSRESMSKGQRLVAKVFQVNRWRQHIFFLCAPYFHWFDVYLRWARVRGLIQLYEEWDSEEGRYIKYGYYFPLDDIKKILRNKWTVLLTEPKWVVNKIEKGHLNPLFYFEVPGKVYKFLYEEWEGSEIYQKKKEILDLSIRLDLAMEQAKYFKKLGAAKLAEVFEKEAEAIKAQINKLVEEVYGFLYKKGINNNAPWGDADARPLEGKDQGKDR